MSTYGTMQDRIANELNRSDLATQIRLAIHSAIDYYEIERFYFNEGRAAMNTVAGQEYYTLPDDFQKADTMVVRENSAYYALTYQPFAQIENDVRIQGSTGFPDYYAIYAEELRLFPVPDDVYRVEFSYQKKLSDLSATADTNSWMTDGEELIRTRAKADVLRNVIRGPEAHKEAQLLMQYERDMAQRLRDETSRRRSTGRVTPYCYGE